MKPFQIRIRQKCDIMPEKLCDSNMKQILDYFDLTLREKCPNTEFFLVSVFSRNWTEYRDAPYLSVFGHF